MKSNHDPPRRTVIAALASLPLSGMAATSNNGGDKRRVGSRILVAYFSRTGSTRVVAGLIHRALGTDLFEIRPASPYPDEYFATVEQARQERDNGYEPKLESTVSNMASYDTVFLGFPIWGDTAPPVIRAFLSRHDLSGKALIPFITHGGYGLGNSRSILASRAPNAQLHQGFVMQAPQERQTTNLVTDWLKALPGAHSES
ncbi:flavodoxin [Pseudomonas lini]